jgi:hypothetical protein
VAFAVSAKERDFYIPGCVYDPDPKEIGWMPSVVQAFKYSSYALSSLARAVSEVASTATLARDDADKPAALFLTLYVYPPPPLYPL